MLFLGGRWSSDLQSDRSLTPPLTVMAVELSGDTGAVIQSYIHVQSARGNTHPVTIIMTEVLRHIFGSGAAVPQVFSLIGLGCLKSHCHFSQLLRCEAQSNFRRLCRSHSVSPSGSWCHMRATSPRRNSGGSLLYDAFMVRN